MTTILSTPDYTVSTLSAVDNDTVSLSIVWDAQYDSDTAPRVSNTAIAEALASEFGGSWKIGGWDAGDAPGQLEGVATARRTWLRRWRHL
jgi:hypothetical protein